MQHVNLYTDAFKPPKVRLPLEQIILFPVLSIFVFVAISFACSAYLDDKKSALAQAQKKNEEMTLRINQMTVKTDSMRQDESLIAANQRLTLTLRARKDMISTLDTVVVKETEGFSNILISLARQKQDGLWLTSINLGASGRQMILEGQTKSASLVPAYLQSLRKESSFVGRNFSIFELKELEGNSNYLGFTLKANHSLEQTPQPITTAPLIQNVSAALNTTPES